MSSAVASNAKGGKGGGGSSSGNNGGSNNSHSGGGRRHGHGHGGGNKSAEKKSQSPAASAAATPTSAPQQQPPQQHPLNRKWTLWYDSPSTYNTDNWELSLLPIMTVTTVEEFFVMLRYMKPLHDLRTSSQYHFFQDGVKPMWEDAANKEGGKIWVNIEIPSNATAGATSATAAATAAAAEGEEKKSAGTPSSAAGTASTKPELDQLWERVLMAVVGEYLEPSPDPTKKEGGSETPQIVGVVMAKRKYHNRLALWVRDAANSAAIETMKKKLKDEAALPASVSLVFTKHGENGVKN